jgi:hypothetical protein
MLHYRTECPHCGNEITVSNEKGVQKCRWCRRLISVKLERTKKRKIRCEVEPMDFPEEQKKSHSRWKEEDIYGRRQY